MVKLFDIMFEGLAPIEGLFYVTAIAFMLSTNAALWLIAKSLRDY